MRPDMNRAVSSGRETALRYLYTTRVISVARAGPSKSFVRGLRRLMPYGAEPKQGYREACVKAVYGCLYSITYQVYPRAGMVTVSGTE